MGKYRQEDASFTKVAKKSTVRNDGQYDQWVRVSINLFEYDAWAKVLGDKFEFNKYFGNFNTDWVLDETTKGTDTLVFYYSKKLLAGEKAPIFESFSIPTEFTVENIPTKFKLNIVGEAIQADNTGNNAKEAFANYWS